MEANLDGSNPQTLITTTGGNEPLGLAVSSQ
jgi:hypothetical protein